MSNVMRIYGVEMVTISQRAALRDAGLAVEVRGGDPLRSAIRNPGVRRTKIAAYVTRVDGRVLTAQDYAIAAEVLS